MSQLYKLSAVEILEGYKKKEFLPSEILEAFLNRIKALDSQIKAFITLNETAFQEAKQLDCLLKNGQVNGKLFGIPVAIKDNICTKNLLTTCASKILEDFIPPYDATVIMKLKEEKAIIIGKTNMDEFAMGSSTENSAFFTTHNPHNLEYVPGGSSGGSAAGVCCGFAPVALGSDTGGSIRQPASFCGIFGFKPTYGLVSRTGLVAFASSLDQIGPFARNIKDLSLLLDTIYGYDPLDSTSIKINPVNFSQINLENKKYTIAVFKNILDNPSVENEINQKFKEILKFLENRGHKINYINFEYVDYGIPCYYLLATSEASSNLARYTGIFFGKRQNSNDFEEMFIKTRSSFLGQEVKRRIILGTFALSSGYYDEYYNKALKVRNVIFQAFQNIFKENDFVMLPTSPIFPFKIKEKVTDPVKLYLCDIFTVLANLSNLPALNIPMLTAGIKQAGLQIIGNLCDDKKVLECGYMLEKELSLEREVVETGKSPEKPHR
ncbi:MAG: Asp-tRNA(Asn)/Glu-tRNA(Gln) amidotransferase subunit GatA [Planctomycetota bacterium]